MTLYFDHAATSWPKPPEVLQAATAFMQTAGVNPGRGSYSLAQQAEAMVERTRRKTAAFFGVPAPARVIFGLNCTDALNMALKGVLQKGEHVLVSRLVHNSVRRPLLQMEAAGWVSVEWLDPDANGFLQLEVWEEALRARSCRLVICNHVSNVLGSIQPIRELAALAHRYGAQILVDAAQSAGVVPLHLKDMNLDLLAFSGHKGLQALPGVGVLCVNDGVEFHSPWREGGTGADSLSPGQPLTWPHFLEAGTPNLSGIASLEAALVLLSPFTLSHHLNETQNWRQELLELVDSKGGIVYGKGPADRYIGTLSCGLPGMSPHIVASILDSSFSIAVRAGLHCAPEAHAFLGTSPEGTVRISMGHSTTGDEVETLKEALLQVLHHLPS